VYNSVENTLQPPKYGLTPRPEHIATRRSFEALVPHAVGEPAIA
jgi:ectoine hydroxylase